MPGIDYTLTKPVDYSAAVDQVINWGANKRQRAIQKQEQEAILGGGLMRSEAKVGANGAVTSGFADPKDLELKRMIDSAKAANYGNMATNRDIGTQGRLAQGRDRVAQGQARTDAYVDKTAKTTPGASYDLPGGTGYVSPPGALIMPDAQDGGDMNGSVLPSRQGNAPDGNAPDGIDLDPDILEH